MRMHWMAAAAACLLAGTIGIAAERLAPVVSSAQYYSAQPAAGPAQAAPVQTMGEAMDYCDACGGSGGRHHKQKHWRGYEGQYPGFHCGCGGSYKYPVPPLYTYHWPGMYSAQLMTDYHSPWRFPPLKPYSDELPLVEGISQNSLRSSR